MKYQLEYKGTWHISEMLKRNIKTTPINIKRNLLRKLKRPFYETTWQKQAGGVCFTKLDDEIIFE